MEKYDEFVITISLDAITAAYLEALMLYSDKTRSSIFRYLVKDNFKKIIESETCYTCLLSAEFKSFRNKHDFSIRMDEESLDLLDYLVDKTDLSRTTVLRGLVIRDFEALKLSLREAFH